MKDLSESNARFEQNLELAYSSELRARHDQVQFSNEPPFQQDSYFPSQLQFYPSAPPTLYPPIQQHFYPLDQPYFPPYDQFFFQNQNPFPNFQTSACDYPHFQHQQLNSYPQPCARVQTEHGYTSQPHAYTDFQQENEFLDYQSWSCHDPQPSQVPSAVLKQAILEALKPSPERSFLNQGVERPSEADADSYLCSHGADSSWNYQDAVAENYRDEEENAFALADKAEAEAWELSQKANKWECGASEEEFREEGEYEQEEMEERRKSFSWSFLHTEQNLPLQKEYGITSRAEQEASLREECERGEAESDVYLTKPGLLQHVEEKEMEEDDYLLYPMFRKGEELIAYFPCEGGIFLQSTHEQQKEEVRGEKKSAAVQYTWLGQEGEAEENDDELESLLQSAQQQEEVREEKELATHELSRLRKEEEAGGFTCEAGGLFLQSALEAQQQGEEEEKKLEEVNDLSLLSREEEEAIAEIACESYLQSAHGYQEKQQQQEGKEEKKKLDALPDLMEAKEEADELTCEDLELLLQEADQLLQHVPSRKEEGENLQPSPYSLQLRRIKEKRVEDFTWADFNFLLHEEHYTTAGQHQCNEKKQEEDKKSAAPDLHKEEAAEPHHQPQDTTPRLEKEAAYPSILNCLSFDFTLTYNQCSLVVKVYISGDKLKTQQLFLIGFYKLQPTELSGDVHKKGARGDGVPWFIKVHPP